eukprot:TRINITY_DN5395_c0_g1_i1.p1 TRINITY_DN5395_c0_g1~~TRINITY_DN5395_c0_g1_i1.p1  ORF type:complete len:130 (-),score=65.14 TRINITY_DN5395_c0_g1_i1:48-437(-)
MGELQADKWHLEENNRHLEETIALMKSDAEKKEAIIRQHVLESAHRESRSTPQMDQTKADIKNKKNSGLLGGLFKDKQLQSEMHMRMEKVLEDTILKNMQLQNDMGILGIEVEKLLEENKVLKKQLSEQ